VDDVFECKPINVHRQNHGDEAENIQARMREKRGKGYREKWASQGTRWLGRSRSHQSPTRFAPHRREPVECREHTVSGRLANSGCLVNPDPPNHARPFLPCDSTLVKYGRSPTFVEVANNLERNVESARHPDGRMLQSRGKWERDEIRSFLHIHFSFLLRQPQRFGQNRITVRWLKKRDFVTQRA
jgi:hypothetical protein